MRALLLALLVLACAQAPTRPAKPGDRAPAPTPTAADPEVVEAVLEGTAFVNVWAAEESMRQEARARLLEEDYDGLEAFAQQMARLEGGPGMRSWQDLLLQGLSGPGTELRLHKWKEKKPRSELATLALAAFYLREGQVQKADALLEPRKKSDYLVFYALKIRNETNRDQTRDASVGSWFLSGRADFATWRAAARFLHERHPKKIERWRKPLSGADYARGFLASLEEYGDDPIREGKWDWAKLKAGYEALSDSRYLLNSYAWAASLAGDREAAGRAFDRIGESWEPAVWKDYAAFEAARRRAAPEDPEAEKLPALIPAGGAPVRQDVQLEGLRRQLPFVDLPELSLSPVERLNRQARAAVERKNREEAHAAFARIGDQWSQPVWGWKHTFSASRKWAARQGPYPFVPVEIQVLDAGRYERTREGGFRLLDGSRAVPCQLGSLFGFRYKIKTSPATDFWLTERFQAPKLSVEKSENFLPGNHVSEVIFLLEDERELMRGTWKVELLEGERALKSISFELK